MREHCGCAVTSTNYGVTNATFHFISVETSACIVLLCAAALSVLTLVRRANARSARSKDAGGFGSSLGAEAEQQILPDTLEVPRSDDPDPERVSGGERAAAPAAAGGGEEAPPLDCVDHARFLLNAVVICWQIVSTLMDCRSTVWSLALSLYVKVCVMPAFGFLSGLLSKGPLDSDRLTRTVLRVWAPYALLNAFSYTSYKLWTNVVAIIYPMPGQPSAELELSLRLPDLTAAWPSQAWYLQCWIAWKMLLPFLKAFEGDDGAQGSRRLLYISIFISWFGGYFMIPSEHTFSTDTAIALLPAFILGYVTPHAALASLGGQLRRACALLHLTLVLLLALLVALTFESCEREAYSGGALSAHALLAWSDRIGFRAYHSSFDLVALCGKELNECEGSYYIYWTQRAVLHLCVLLFAGTLVMAMPNRRTRFSAHGRHALYAYLLQATMLLPFVLPARTLLGALVAALRAPPLPCDSWAQLPLCMLVAIASTLAMTSEPVRRAMCVVFEPTYLNWLFELPSSKRPHFLSLVLFLALHCAAAFAHRRLGRDVQL
jgi:hypothetical protein